MDETMDMESAQPAEFDDAATTSRRHLFAMGAAAVAGATIADVLISGTADAATGGPVVIGMANTVTTASDITSLTGRFSVTDANNEPPGGTAITGTHSFLGTNPAFGVQGVTHTLLSSLTGLIAGAGVLGVHAGGGAGLMGESSGNGPQLQLVPGGVAGTPIAPQTGQFYVGSDGALHFCHGGGAFSPLNSVVPLPAPVRVINTTSGVGGIVGPIAPGPGVHTSSVLSGLNGIPSNAIGLVGNFAISGVGGALLNGFGVATIFPAGVAAPATANINSGAGCFAISNAATVAFGTGGNAGKVALTWGGGGSVPNAQAFFDVTAYLI
jgi:hypothetical protein